MQAATPEVPTPLASEPSQAQMEDLENQLSLQIEARLKAEYDQRLAEAIERYQDEMVERTQALEQRIRNPSATGATAIQCRTGCASIRYRCCRCG